MDYGLLPYAYNVERKKTFVELCGDLCEKK